MPRDAGCDRGKQQRRYDHSDQPQKQVSGQSRLRCRMRGVDPKFDSRKHREKSPRHQRRFANRKDDEARNARSSEASLPRQVGALATAQHPRQQHAYPPAQSACAMRSLLCVRFVVEVVIDLLLRRRTLQLHRFRSHVCVFQPCARIEQHHAIARFQISVRKQLVIRCSHARAFRRKKDALVPRPVEDRRRVSPHPLQLSPAHPTHAQYPG